jgi:TatD DNase family protein
VALCPLDRLLVETDSPFLAPVPHRGTRNEPGNVALVGSFVAELRGVEPSVVAASSSDAAARAFAIAPS